MTEPAAPEGLRPDNFTPPERTPWGGKKIKILKRGLDLREPARSYEVVGESWEVSVDTTYPSIVARTDRPLAELLAKDPDAWFGARPGNDRHPSLPLLLKWIDTADALSVQVHPPESFAGLRPGESGKWEAWYIVETEPGAGLHLGFREGTTRAGVERCIASAGRMEDLLNFVPVQPGDVFVIEPGTPHALGAGITLLEPQVTTGGTSGVTYRFWDWNRRYDARGRPAANGQPRPLHIAESLEVIRWDIAADPGFVQACRRQPRSISDGAGIDRDVLIESEDLVVERWRGSGDLAWHGDGLFHSLTCISGKLMLATEAGTLAMRGGESAVVPAATGDAGVTCRDLELIAVGLRHRR
jgi:mannose-6-phosphate isomerase